MNKTALLQNVEWLCDLAFLVDITAFLNELNLKLQGYGKFITTLVDSVKSFARKLTLLQKQLKDGNLTHFPACKEISSKYGPVLQLLCSNKYFEIIGSLLSEFDRRFSDFRSHEQSFAIFQNPFTCEPEFAPVDMQLELIDLQESSEARTSYHALNLLEFYQSLSVLVYPTIRRHAQRVASLFGATYICEKTFSTMNITKSKMRSRLTDDHLQAILRIATTSFEPRFVNIIAEKSQLHKSDDVHPQEVNLVLTQIQKSKSKL